MPDPSDYENKDDFVSACIAQRQDEKPDESQEQSIAICMSMWAERTGGKKVVHKTHITPDTGVDFILSDASPDRFDDVIRPDGWDIKNFLRNPIALFNHNKDFPVGRWENLHVKDGALKGRLRFAPAGTSQRIDEIRKLVEAGILRAVSVGFIPQQDEPRAASKSGGRTYIKSELVETSLVSIPANPNALSIAKGLVSDDTLKLVFSEHGDRALELKHRGIHGKNADHDVTKRKVGTMGPLSKRIQEEEQRIVALRDELTKHLETVNDDNPDEAATVVTEELTAKLAKREKNLASLKSAEERLAVQTVDRSADDRGDSNLVVSSRRPFAVPARKIEPREYIWRALACQIKSQYDPKHRPVLEHIKAAYGEDEATRVIYDVITRAASVPADTTTDHWASQLVTTVQGDFLNALQPLSVYPKLAGMGGSFTFGANGKVNLPYRQSTPTVGGGFIAQGAPIPVKQAAFEAVEMTPKKVGVITTMSREIAEHSIPQIEGLLRNAILEDTAVAIDTILLDATAASAIRPAGLRNYNTETAVTAGGGIAALIGDIKALVAALITGTNGNLRRPVWLMNPGDVLAAQLTQAAAGGDFPFLAELARGQLFGYPVLQTTTGLTDMLVLLDASDFATATGAAPQFSVSDQAVLHMEDTSPAALSTGTGPTVATPIRSLWQTDTMAIRMIMDINWLMRRTSVVWCDTLTWN